MKRTSTIMRNSGLGVFLAGVFALAGCEGVSVPGGGQQAAMSPAGALAQMAQSDDAVEQEQEACEDGGQTEAELEETIAKAIRVAKNNRVALAQLRKDRRWNDPEQHEFLQTAVDTTKQQVAMNDARADDAKCQLDLRAK